MIVLTTNLSNNMSILKNKLATFWFAIITASILNIAMATIDGMDMMVKIGLSPMHVSIITAVLLAYAYFRLCIKKNTDCGSKDFFSFKSHKLQKTMLWINVILIFSMFFGCNTGLPF